MLNGEDFFIRRHESESSMTGQDISEMIQFFFRFVETHFCPTFTAENRPKDFLAALLRWLVVFGFEAFVSLLLR